MDTRIQNPRIQQLVAPAETPKVAPKQGADGVAFEDLLRDRLKVSGHAQTRLASRNIEMGPAEWDRVMGGVDRAAQKGAKESLVMMDDIALVVSVKNRTVITAVDRDSLKNNVFTNIDSAVIV